MSELEQLSELEQKFNEMLHAVRDATIDFKPDNNQKLKLYAFYKQATVGDVNTDKPSFFNFKDTSKWNAWEKLKGMQKIQAQGNYIKLVKDLEIKSKQ